MTPTAVDIGVMDSQKPPMRVTLPVHHLGLAKRLGRGLLRMLFIAVPGLLIAIIPPHPCGLSIAFIAGPVMGLVVMLQQALFGEADITCPKCHETIPLPPRLSGWPARFSCPRCKAMVELRPVAPEHAP